MAKSPRDSGPATPPSDFPQVTPRDLYPTSDIRFVLVELGKLTANVERLIRDVGSQGQKIDTLSHQATWLKGALAASVILIGAFIGLASWFLNLKWDSILQAISQIGQP